MNDLSPPTRAVLDAWIDENCGDQPMPSEIKGLAAALRALANHQRRGYVLDGPQDHWDASDYTRRELRNIAAELDDCVRQNLYIC